MEIKKARNTRQKSDILECLKKHKNTHITAEEILGMLKDEEKNASLATVYRYLKTLEEDMLVKKYVFAEASCASYQYIDDMDECMKHYHLKCDVCGMLVHLNDKDLFKVLRGIEINENFELDNVKTIFYGKCKKCRRKERVRV